MKMKGKNEGKQAERLYDLKCNKLVVFGFKIEDFIEWGNIYLFIIYLIN